MSLFNLPVVHKKKEAIVHPWAKTIKEYYADRIKRAHNSVRNPVYPEPKPKLKEVRSRVKFSIFGDQLTKEFIYCVYLVQNMHKYRPKIFDCPDINGLTAIEWPRVKCNLWAQFGPNVKCISPNVVVLYNDRFLGGMEELKNLLETRHSLHLAMNYKKEIISQFLNYVKSSGRPCAYLHISVNKVPIGCLIFMLYSDVCPKTCNNFLRLCKTRKGGYSGTPVHRIVKDGWIQCGGFGLKDVPMQCENFIVDFDRRGILGMANADRDVDCSTQFFVLLEPQPWMKHKYVAFGQLIEGAETLKKIAAVETFYESPKSEIIIYRAGILNLDCQDIFINKNANEYIDKHIDDLVAVGELFYEMLLGYVFLEIEFKYLLTIEGKAEDEEEEKTRNIRATQRFMKRKEELQNQIGNRSPNRISSLNLTKDKEKKREKEEKVSLEFDVEEYELKSEDTSSETVSPVTVSIEKQKKPFYVPLTDVPYPGERDSNFDLKRLLKGDYCLEADLNPKLRKKEAIFKKEQTLEKLKEMSLFMSRYVMHDKEEEEIILDLEQEQKYQEYLEQYIEIVSMGGPIIREIAKHYSKVNPLDTSHERTRFTDEDVRKIRLAERDQLVKSKHKVGVTEAPWATHGKITRRETGFFSPAEMLKFSIFNKSQEEGEVEQEEEEETSPKKKTFAFAEGVKVPSTSSSNESVDIPSRHASSIRFKLEDDAEKVATKIIRRPTGFVRPEMLKHLRKFKKQLEGDDEDSDEEDDDEDDDDDDDDDDEDKIQDVDDAEITDIHTLPSSTSAVRLAVPKVHSENKILRRPTAFVRQKFEDEKDDNEEGGGENYDVFENTDVSSPEPKKDEEQEEKTSPKWDDDLVVTKPAPLSPSKSKQVQGFVVEKKLSAQRIPHYQPRFEVNDNNRVSTLARLYKDVNVPTEDVPTLKEYKPIAEIQQEKIKLTASHHFFGPDDDLDYHVIRSPDSVNESLDRLMNLHREKNRISQEYIQIIEPVGKQATKSIVINKSIRAIDYAKHRPTMSVNQYQQKYLNHPVNNVTEKKPDHNKKRRSTAVETNAKPWTRGIRLPGDSPLYASLQSIQKQ